MDSGSNSERLGPKLPNSRHLFDLAQSYLKETAIKPFSTGYEKLDSALNGGIYPKTLTILGGRPGEGKTSLVLSMAVKMAQKGLRVLFISLEMSYQELLDRVFCEHYAKTQRELIALKEAGQFPVLIKTFMDKLKQFKFQLEDERGATLSEVGNILMELRNDPPQVLFLDHLQLSAFGDTISKAEGIANYLRDLKMLAKETGMALIVCSQINRTVYSTGGKDTKPQAHQLKASGAIEEIADLILLGHRKSPDEILLSDEESVRDLEYEIYIAKNRKGPQKMVSMIFRPAHFTFLEPASTWNVSDVPEERNSNPTL